MNKKQVNLSNSPVTFKLTEARRLKLNTVGWGLLTDYSLESVKITNYKGLVASSATIRISDRSGQITCVIKGPYVGLLFGLSCKQWKEIETMCNCEGQLFYRYFKNGINKEYSSEQRIFYNFCMTSQKNDVLVARCRRSVNMRNKFKTDAFLDILELRKCNESFLDTYVNQLRNSCDMTLQTS